MPTFLVVKKKPEGTQKKRLVVSVGRDAGRRATTRNLLKRRIKAIMRGVLEESKGDFTVIAKKGASDLAFAALREEILNKTK